MENAQALSLEDPSKEVLCAQSFVEGSYSQVVLVTLPVDPVATYPKPFAENAAVETRFCESSSLLVSTFRVHVSEMGSKAQKSDTRLPLLLPNPTYATLLITKVAPSLLFEPPKLLMELHDEVDSSYL